MQTGNHQAGKHPSSKCTLPYTTQNPSLATGPLRIALFLRLTCKGAKLWFGSCNLKWRTLSTANARQRRLEGPFSAPLRKASFYWVKTGCCGYHRDIKSWLRYPIDILKYKLQFNTKDTHFFHSTVTEKQTNNPSFIKKINGGFWRKYTKQYLLNKVFR